MAMEVEGMGNGGKGVEKGEESGQGEVEKREKGGEREEREKTSPPTPPCPHLSSTAASEAPSPVRLCSGLGFNTRIEVWTTTFSP